MKLSSGFCHVPATPLCGAVFAALAAFAPSAAGAAEGAQAALLADAQLQSQALTTAVLQIERANDAGFAQLSQAYANLNADMKVLLRGGNRGSCQVAAPDKAMQEALEPMQEAMAMLEKAVNIMGSNRAALAAARGAVETIRNTSQALEAPLQALIDKQTAPAQMGALKALAQMNVLRVRINLNAERLLQAQLLSPENAFAMGKDVNVLLDWLNGLTSGSAALKLTPLQGDAKDKLADIAKSFDRLKDGSNTLLQNLQRIVHQQEVVGIAMSNADVIIQTSQKLAKPPASGPGCSVN